MSISELVLFYTSNSHICMPIVHKFKTISSQMNELVMTLSPLDTKASRMRVMSNKSYPIKTVPSMFLIYDDGDVKFAQNAETIDKILDNVILAKQEHHNELEESPIKKTKKKSKKKSTEHESPEIIFTNDIEEEIPVPQQQQQLMFAPKIDKNMQTKELARQMLEAAKNATFTPFSDE